METRVAAASFLEYCRLRSLQPKTIDFYRWGLKHLARHCHELPDHHRELMRPLANPSLCQESRHDLERVLRRFFRWAHREYRVAKPMVGVEPIPRKRTISRVLSKPEIEAVWRACDTDRDRAMIALALNTGLRLSEITSMEKRNLLDGVLRVSGKIGQRQVPVTPEVSDMLKQIGNEAAIWVGRGRRLTTSGVHGAYERIFRRAGLTGPKLSGPHCLPHTFGTEYVARGGNVRVLQAIMGHQRIETTMVYVTLAGQVVARDHAEFSPFRQLLL